MQRLFALLLISSLTACDNTPDASAPIPRFGDDTAMTATADSSGGETTPAATRAHVFQFGLYKATAAGQLIDSSSTNTGKVVRKPTLEHVSMTDRVPLLKGTYFGYQYRLFKLPPAVAIKPFMPLRKVLIHPPMTLPDGSTTTGWDRTFTGRVETQQVMGFDGYGFHEDYELVEGEWIFQLWYEDEKLIERRFVSYRPDVAQAGLDLANE